MLPMSVSFGNSFRSSPQVSWVKRLSTARDPVPPHHGCRLARSQALKTSDAYSREQVDKVGIQHQRNNPT